MDTKKVEKKVEIYSTATCHFCRMAKEWMTLKNIPFTDYNVGENMEKRKEMVAITGQIGVPVIKIGDDVMIGFDQDRMAELLGIK